MGSASDAREFRKAMYDRCVTLFASATNPVTRVTRDRPAFNTEVDIVCVRQVETNQDFATFGSNRSREEDLTVEVEFWSFRFGTDAAAEAAEARAWAMLDAVAEYVRVTDTTLGGVVRHCFLTRAVAGDSENEDVMAQGRLHLVVATFTAQNRVTS